MNRYSSLLWLTGAAAVVAAVATTNDAEGAGVPATPTPTLQSSTYNSVTLAWPMVTGAQQYTVQLCTVAMCRGETPKLFKVDPTTTAGGEQVVYTLSNLSASTRYYMYVQTVVLTPEAAKSPFSLVVDVTTPAAPPITLRAALENNDSSTCFYYTVPSGAGGLTLRRYADLVSESSIGAYGMSGDNPQCFRLEWKEGDACPSTYYTVSASSGSGPSSRSWESERV